MAKPEFEFTPTSSVDFAPCNPHIEGLSEAILARDSDNDSVTRILKFEPGTDTSPNGVLTHDFWEEVFIFEGSFVDQRLGKTFQAGDWATRPPGMEHGPWVSETGAKMFEVRYYRDPEPSERSN
ncbi:cupin domain-containing protein [Paenarthrobacter sp. 2TAF44]|uniref:cupin domain-containing protein n=1 Tax=Paenarthrobacter sp. 2TAF44 TaxID=3233018 RepID=UPI003F9CECD1